MGPGDGGASHCLPNRNERRPDELDPTPLDPTLVAALVPLGACKDDADTGDTGSPRDPAVLCVNAGTLIDGSEADPQTDRLVVVRDGTIEAVVDASESSARDCGRTLDAGDAWVIPGLFDMHTHVTLTERRLNPMIGRLSTTWDEEIARWMLRAQLFWGVTTVRDTAALFDEGLALRASVGAGDIPGPRLFMAGPLLEGSEPVWSGGISVSLASDEVVAAEVERQADAGFDFLKVYTTLGPEQTRIAIETAHARGLRVLSHLGATTWEEAVGMGIDRPVHSLPYTDWNRQDPSAPDVLALLDSMAAAGIANDPTIEVFAKMYHPQAAELVPAEVLATVPDTMRSAWEAEMAQYSAELKYGYANGIYDQALGILLDYVAIARAAGVPLLAGTDQACPLRGPGLVAARGAGLAGRGRHPERRTRPDGHGGRRGVARDRRHGRNPGGRQGGGPGSPGRRSARRHRQRRRGRGGRAGGRGARPERARRPVSTGASAADPRAGPDRNTLRHRISFAGTQIAASQVSTKPDRFRYLFTRRRLQFEVAPRPPSSTAFPGPRPAPRPQNRTNRTGLLRGRSGGLGS